jgi:glutathione S-transferase
VGWETDTLRVGVRAEILDVPRLALLRLRSSRVFVAERRLDSTTLRRAIDPSIEWQGHYIDILKGDQFDPAYTKLNAKAVVPTLVHDGHPIVESTVICEYIDDVFPSPPLKLADPLQRAEILEVWVWRRWE